MYVISMPENDPDQLKRRRTFLSVVLAHGLLDFYAVVWPIFKYLARLDIAVAGGLSTATGIVASLTQPLFGHLAEKGGARAYILIGTGLTFAMMLLGPLALLSPRLGPGPAVLAMLSVLFLTRLGQAIFHPVGASVAGTYAQGKRATYLSIFVLAGWLGPALGQPVFSWVYLATGGHTELLIPPGLLLFALIYAWCRPGRLAAPPSVQAAAIPPAVRKPGLKRRLAFIFGVLALMDAVHMGLSFLLPELAELKGCPAWAVHGGAMFIFTSGTVVTMVPLGRLADRAGGGRMLLATLFLSLFFYILLLALPAGFPALTLTLLFLLGAFIGIANPLGVAHGQELVPGRTGLVSGIMMGWAWAFGGISPAILGILARQPALGPLGALWWLGTAIGAAIIFAILFLNNRFGRD